MKNYIKIFEFREKIPFLNIYSYLIFLFCFFFPIIPLKTAPIWIVYGLFWLLEGHFKKKFELLKGKSQIWLFIPMILYILHIIGIFYSKNIDFGLFDLQVKLSLLLLPLFLGTLPKEFFCKKSFDRVFISFIIGSLCYAIYAIGIASYKYFILGGLSTEVFFYTQLSEYIHPSYAALYSGLSIAFIWILFVQKRKISQKVYLFIAACFLSIFSVLLASKSGIISLAVVWVFGIGTLIVNIIKTKLYQFLTFLCCIVILSGLFVFSVKNISFVAERFEELTILLGGGAAEVSGTTGVRVKLWKSACNLIPQHFLFGVGTGDVKDIFIEEYLKLRDPLLENAKLNPHNQFLQSFLALGILGFLSLVAFLVVVPIYLGIKNKYPLLLLFAAMAIINNLVESMIEVQGGVMFFAFFYCLLIMHSCFVYKQNENPKSLN